MATFETLKSGKIKAAVCVNKVREKKTFPNITKAKSWANEREAHLRKLDAVVDDSRTVRDLFDRYANEISSNKKGAHWEILRLNMFIREYPSICSKRLIKLAKADFQMWIKERGERVKSSTVNRELNLISHCLTVAREDWMWMSHNPMKGLKRPKNPKARVRRVCHAETQELGYVMDYREQSKLTMKKQFTMAAFLFAIETAMRAGEICSLTLPRINFDTKVAYLPHTKNGDERYVPLTDRAIQILEQLPEVDDDISVFQLKPGSLSSTFLKYRKMTTIEDLTFHDSRHEAITRLAAEIEVLDLARVTGHKNINELMTYYDESPEAIAKKLNDNRQSNTHSIEKPELLKQLLIQSLAEKMSEKDLLKLLAA